MATPVKLKDARDLSSQERKWAYNAIDNVATEEVAQNLEGRMSPAQRRYYEFTLAMQGPAFTMSTRGVKIDPVLHDKMLRKAKEETEAALAEIVSLPQITAVWDGKEKVTGACRKSKRKDGRHTWEPGVPDTPERKCTECGRSRFKPVAFNPGSDDQVKHLLYDLLRVPIQFNKDKKAASDKEALERIANKFPKFRDVAQKLRNYADVNKQRGFLEFRKTPDGRYMSDVTVGTAWTGRLASSADAFGFGGNGQNISERFRGMFVADEGMELCYVDIKSAESNTVAHLSGDENYILAHKGDTHTFVSHMVFGKELEWPEDPEDWKEFATSHYPVWDNKPGHDYRYQAKAVQHGSNLGLTPFGLAIQKRITQKAALLAQTAYFEAFPRIRGWQEYVDSLVKAQEKIVNPLGFEVRLLGRPADDHTRKQALAFLPQSVVVDIIGIGMWRIWRAMDPHEVQLLLQIHDALLFQFPKGRYDIAKKACNLLRVPIRIVDYTGVERVMTLQVEANVGDNWGHAVDQKDIDKAVAEGRKPPELNVNGMRQMELD